VAYPLAVVVVGVEVGVEWQVVLLDWVAVCGAKGDYVD